MEVPSPDVQLVLDAVFLRAHLPPDFDMESLSGPSLSFFALGDDGHVGSSIHRFGASEASDGTVEKLLPTGPGYGVKLSTGDDQEYVAILAAGMPSSAYDINFEAESPMLAAVEVGDEALLEVELIQGGGLSMDRDGLTWRPHLTYHDLTETQYTSSVNLEPGTLYRSMEALPPGSTRFRLRGEGYQTMEVDIFISACSLAEWNPVVQKAP